jgi:hypothetical protein
LYRARNQTKQLDKKAGWLFSPKAGIRKILGMTIDECRMTNGGSRFALSFDIT